jgi:hypothetical protein
MAAAAIGLCASRDGGVTWDVERDGLHASYCSAVAFAGDDVLVSASVDHFAAQRAIYRRRVDRHDSLVAVCDGLPAWTDGTSTPVALPRAARQSRSPIRRATSTYRLTPVVAGRAEPVTSHFRAASSSPENQGTHRHRTGTAGVGRRVLTCDKHATIRPCGPACFQRSAYSLPVSCTPSSRGTRSAPMTSRPAPRPQEPLLP